MKFFAKNENVLTRDLAKMLTECGLKWGQKDLFAWMIAKGLLNEDKGPKRSYLDAYWFERVQGNVQLGAYSKVIYTTYITPRGQRGIARMLGFEADVKDIR